MPLSASTALRPEAKDPGPTRVNRTWLSPRSARLPLAALSSAESSTLSVSPNWIDGAGALSSMAVTGPACRVTERVSANRPSALADILNSPLVPVADRPLKLASPFCKAWPVAPESTALPEVMPRIT